MEGLGDAIGEGNAARGVDMFIPEIGVVGVDGGFNVLAGEAAGAGVPAGVGGAELFPCGEARGFAGAEAGLGVNFP